MNTVIKTYKTARRYRHGARRMARRGYCVVGSFQEPSKNKPLRNLLKMPFGGTWTWGSSMKGGKIIVTYQQENPLSPSTLAPDVYQVPAPSYHPQPEPAVFASRQSVMRLQIALVIILIIVVFAILLHAF